MFFSLLVLRYLEGLEVASREVFKDVMGEDEADTLKKVEALENMEIAKKDEVSGTPRVEPPSNPAVVSVLSLKSSLFLVQVEGFSGLLVYGIQFGISNSAPVISLKHTLTLDDSFLLDYGFDASSETLFLLVKKGKAVSLDTYKLEFSKLVKESSRIFNDTTFGDPKDIFGPLASYEKTGLENLHKRWFDNVKDYMEKKASRQEQMKRKEPPVKKQKVEN